MGHDFIYLKASCQIRDDTYWSNIYTFAVQRINSLYDVSHSYSTWHKNTELVVQFHKHTLLLWSSRSNDWLYQLFGVSSLNLTLRLSHHLIFCNYSHHTITRLQQVNWQAIIPYWDVLYDLWRCNTIFMRLYAFKSQNKEKMFSHFPFYISPNGWTKKKLVLSSLHFLSDWLYVTTCEEKKKNLFSLQSFFF